MTIGYRIGHCAGVIVWEFTRLFSDIKATFRFWREIRRAGRHGDALDQRIVDAGMSMVSSAIDRMDYASNPEAFR